MAAAQMSPLLLGGICLPGMEWGPTCVPSMPDLEHTRMKHHEQAHEQVFSPKCVNARFGWFRTIRASMDRDGRPQSICVRIHSAVIRAMAALIIIP